MMTRHDDHTPHSLLRARNDGDDQVLKTILCHADDATGGNAGSPALRISAIFVILVVSSTMTAFPIVARNQPRWRIPRFVYLFSRYFGAGVIIATAFIHLLDPAYQNIGPVSCVALTAGWGHFPWPAAIALTSVMFVFLLDFGAEWYVENKYNFGHASEPDAETSTTTADATAPPTPDHDNGNPLLRLGRMVDSQDDMSNQVTMTNPSVATFRPRSQTQCSHQFLHSADQDIQDIPLVPRAVTLPNMASPFGSAAPIVPAELHTAAHRASLCATDRAFHQQIAAFLILEFGVIFHSVIIGLNLGVMDSDFLTLYPVIAFHQAFEGLGLGARLSMIPFPHQMSWMPWVLCLAYGFTTPTALACGMGMAESYNGDSYTAMLVSGVLDSISAGILLYTGLVELLARDFLFNKERSRDPKDIFFMLGCLLLGTALMALLGKWT